MKGVPMADDPARATPERTIDDFLRKDRLENTARPFLELFFIVNSFDRYRYIS
jgi:hypothetical protein